MLASRGQISPNDVLGRDAFIRSFWQILKGDSIILTAERRTGKTSVITKMVAEAPTHIFAVYEDLEYVNTALQFAVTVFRSVRNEIGNSQRVSKEIRLFASQFTGGEVSGAGVGLKAPSMLPPNWKDMLISVIKAVTENHARTVIFFWDEMPSMIEKIGKTENPSVAIEVLNTLRHLRQDRELRGKLRMVFTGSIGFHHVVTELKEQGHNSTPLNDMRPVELDTLSTENAQRLVKQLLIGEKIITSDIDAAAQAIASAGDNIPFYIVNIINLLQEENLDPTVDNVEKVLSSCITMQPEFMDLNYYRDRLKTYYTSEDENMLVEPLLDILAVAKEPLDFDTIFNLVGTGVTVSKPQIVRDILDLLRRDHYLVIHPDGTYEFRYPLIQRYWRQMKGLSK